MVEGKSTHPLPLTGSWQSRISYIHTYIHLLCMFLKAQMPDHHLLNGLFSHGGREKYPPAALDWVLAVRNLIHTYIHTYIHKIKYIPLIQNLSQLYSQYKYETVTIVIGAMGAVPKSLNQNIEKLSKYINKEKGKTLIPRIQKAALLGTVKILKTVLKM